MSTTSSPRLLRRQDVQRLTGLSKSGLYKRMGEGSFPRPIKLGHRTALWPEKAVHAWIKEQIEGGV